MATKLQDLTAYAGPLEPDMRLFAKRATAGVWAPYYIEAQDLNGGAAMIVRSWTYTVDQLYSLAVIDLLADIDEPYMIERAWATYTPGASPLGTTVAFRLLNDASTPIATAHLKMGATGCADTFELFDADDAPNLERIRLQAASSYATGDGSITIGMAYERLGVAVS